MNVVSETFDTNECVVVCCFQWASVASWFLRPEMAGASVPPIVPQPPPMPIRPSRTSSDPPQMAMPPTICTVCIHVDLFLFFIPSKPVCTVIDSHQFVLRLRFFTRTPPPPPLVQYAHINT